MRCALLAAVVIATVLAQDLVPACPRPNGYFPDAQYCDRYLECRDGVGEQKSCPDGLLVNEKAANFRYPCDYPVDVDCGSRTVPVAAPVLNTAGNCPRLWGMFFAGYSSADCGKFMTCVNGIDYRFDCPEGLAWHPQLWRCEWPDEVPSCDVEAFLGFKCPGVLPDNVLAKSTYRHPTDCARYFICVNGVSPRLQVCPPRTVFNPVTGDCGEPLNVPGCENYYPPLPAEDATTTTVSYQESG